MLSLFLVYAHHWVLVLMISLWTGLVPQQRTGQAENELCKLHTKSMATVNFLVINSFQNIFFCAQQKTATRAGLEQMEGE